MTLIFMLSFLEGVSPTILLIKGIWRSLFPQLFNLEANKTEVQGELNLLDIKRYLWQSKDQH